MSYKQVTVTPIATFQNRNLKFSAVICDVENPDHQVALIGEQGSVRLVLGGSREQLRAFLETALRGLDAQ